MVFELFDGATLVFYPNRFQGCFIIFITKNELKHQFLLTFLNTQNKHINTINQIVLSFEDINSYFESETSLDHASLSSIPDFFFPEDF